MLRLFLAIELSPLHKEALASICYGLNHVKWTPRNQLHLTLHFLGEIEENKLDQINQALQELCSVPFDFVIKGVGHFTKQGQVHTIWADIVPNEELDFLYQEMKERLKEAGIFLPHKNFRPHITIARCSHDVDLQEIVHFLERLSGLSLSPSRADHINLFSSKLKPEGAIYTLEQSYPL